MKLTEEQILKIATSHQKQMGSVHPHAIIGTIVEAINEALSQHDVSGAVCENPHCRGGIVIEMYGEHYRCGICES